jgi:hypothetical protein
MKKTRRLEKESPGLFVWAVLKQMQTVRAWGANTLTGTRIRICAAPFSLLADMGVP